MCTFVHEMRQWRAFCKPAFLKMSNIMIFDLTRFGNNFFIFLVLSVVYISFLKHKSATLSKHLNQLKIQDMLQNYIVQNFRRVLLILAGYFSHSDVNQSYPHTFNVGLFVEVTRQWERALCIVYRKTDSNCSMFCFQKDLTLISEDIPRIQNATWCV